jgi:glycosyltransferase involved in cell wall biosynthesis
VIDGVTGHVFEPRDPKTLAQAVTVVMNENVDSLGRSARRLIDERFSIAWVAEQYEALYQTLVG